MAEISWLMFTNCHDHCHCVYTEVTERESTKVCHMLKSGSDLKMHVNSTLRPSLWYRDARYD